MMKLGCTETAAARSDAGTVTFDRYSTDAWFEPRADVPGYELESPDLQPWQDEVEDVDWMERLVEFSILEHLDPASIHSLYTRLREFPVAAGKVILDQGENCDTYYIIVKGRCVMSRQTNAGATVWLGMLGPGDAFGDEPILTEAPSSITLTMNTDGLLLTLSKGDFEQLMKEPLLRTVTAAQAQRMCGPKPRYLDVRLPNEQVEKVLEDSEQVPLFMLRLKAEGFNRDQPYICYCNDGRLSSSAAFFLRTMGFDSYVLAGGLALRGLPEYQTASTAPLAETANGQSRAQPSTAAAVPMSGAPRNGLRARGTGRSARDLDTLTLGTLLSTWIERARDFSGNTVSERDRKICRMHLIPTLGQIRLGELDKRRVDSYCSKALTDGRLDGKGGLAVATVNRHVLVLERALAEAREQGLTRCDLLDPDPARALTETPSVKLSEELRDEVLEAAVGTPFHLPSLLASTTGLMLVEILALRWLDLRGDRLRVSRYMVQTPMGLEYRCDADGYKCRTFALPAAVVDELARYRENAARDLEQPGTDEDLDNELMIRRADGTAWAPDAMVSAFQDLLRRVGVETSRFEELYCRGTPGLAVELLDVRDMNVADGVTPQPEASAEKGYGADQVSSDEVADLLEHALSLAGKRF